MFQSIYLFTAPCYMSGIAVNHFIMIAWHLLPRAMNIHGSAADVSFKIVFKDDRVCSMYVWKCTRAFRFRQKRCFFNCGVGSATATAMDHNSLSIAKRCIIIESAHAGTCTDLGVADPCNNYVRSPATHCC